MRLLDRLLKAALVWLVTVSAVLAAGFALLKAAPGDPVMAFMGAAGGMDAERAAVLSSSLGLDVAWPEQLMRYLLSLAQGEWGTSLLYSRPVLELIGERIGPSTLLIVASSIAAAVLGTLGGAAAAYFQRHWLARAVSVCALALSAMPAFVTGLLLLMIFAVTFPLFPVGGLTDAGQSGLGGAARAADMAYHLVLPTLTLSLFYTPHYFRSAQLVAHGVLRSDFMRTARAKGLGQAGQLRHAVVHLWTPVLMLLEIQLGAVVAGAVIVETVFSIPAMGSLVLDALMARDFPLLLGILQISAIAVLTASALLEALSRLIDPRMSAVVTWR